MLKRGLISDWGIIWPTTTAAASSTRIREREKKNLSQKGKNQTAAPVLPEKNITRSPLCFGFVVYVEVELNK